MGMKFCTACGARNYVRDEWTGGDKNCDHFFCETMVDERLVSELKRLMTSWRPEEIVAGMQQVCGCGRS